jgi:hypothetical protein
VTDPTKFLNRLLLVVNVIGAVVALIQLGVAAWRVAR